MAFVIKVLLGLGLCLVLAAQNVQAAEYFRGRTITGAGVFAWGDKSILLIDVSGDKAAMVARLRLHWTMAPPLAQAELLCRCQRSRPARPR